MVDTHDEHSAWCRSAFSALFKFVKEAADPIRGGGIGRITVAKCYTC
jgi:hypothetical protein